MENLNAEQIKKALDWLNCIPGNAYDYDSEMAELTLSLIKQLINENERLQKALNTDISIVRVSRGSGKTAHLREVGRIKVDAIRADTVRKMQSEIKKYYSQPKYLPTPRRPIKHTTIDLLFVVLDQIAKEMVEGKG